MDYPDDMPPCPSCGSRNIKKNIQWGDRIKEVVKEHLHPLILLREFKGLYMKKVENREKVWQMLRCGNCAADLVHCYVCEKLWKVAHALQHLETVDCPGCGKGYIRLLG